MTSQQFTGHLWTAAIAAYGQQAVEQPAMQAALTNLTAALARIRQEPLEPTDEGPFRSG